MHAQINLLHDLHVPQRLSRTLPGSTVRIGFLRAWMFTAMKVLLIAGILHGSGFVATVENNIALLDQYARNDFSTVASSVQILAVPKHTPVTKVIIAQALQPRGPAASALGIAPAELGQVAGDSDPSPSLLKKRSD